MVGWHDIMTTGPLLVLVICRLAGLLALTPGFGHLAVPLKVRLLLVVVIALAMLPRMSSSATRPSTLGELIAAGLIEAMLGAAMGLAVRTILAGLELAGWHISQQMGL